MPTQSVNKIARKIHDGIAQDLVALGYSIDQSLGAADLSVTTRSELRSIRFQVTELIKKVRIEILELRNTALIFSDSVVEICGSKLGLCEIPAPIDIAVQPIIIELLRNAVTHSGANVINLRSYFEQDKTLIEVSDDGIGGHNMSSNGFGLLGVTEAVAELKGQIEFLKLEPGLLIRVSIPK